MNYNKRIRIVGIISSVIITIIILAGICVYATLPWLVRGYVSAADIKLNPNSYEVMLSLLYCVGIPVLVLLGLALTLTVNDRNGTAKNKSAMKLGYTPKTGVFKGSFKVYAIQGGKLKKLTVKVNGVVVDGEGRGRAVPPKSSAAWTVSVK